MSMGKVETISFYSGTSSSERLNSVQNKEEAFNRQSKSLNASKLNMGQDDVTAKKIRAQKQAIKNLLDTFKGMKSVDDSISALNQKAADLKSRILESENSKEEAVQKQEYLMKQYGIDKDGQEYADFELLYRQQSAAKNKRNPNFTEEEAERLANMGEPTDFQKQALMYADVVEELDKKIENDTHSILMVNESVKGIRLELLKSDPMVEAQKTADNIMDAANKEVIGMLIDEAKEHVDETREEEIEKAEKKKEEKEELEARIEAAKSNEDKEDNEEEISQNILDVATGNVKGLAKADELQQKIENEIKLMLLKQKITADDIKGIEVDTQS